MATIPSNQGAPQFSNLAAQDALPLVGTPSRENGQSVLNSIDSTLAKLFENTNILLSEGGTIAWSTTSNNLTFSAALKLHINSQIAGGSPTVIDLTSTTRAFSADNRMLYAVINRIAGTATVTADATTLPSVVAANIEVVLLAKRISGQIYFRNGFTLANGQTAVLGRHGSVIDTEFVINDSTDPTKQLAFDAAGTTGTKTTITGSQTDNRVQTLQDATDTFVYRATTDSLSNKQVGFSSSTDSTTTGSNTTLASFSTGIVRLTNSSLVSLSGIPGGASGLSVIVENKTGNSIVINNEEATATAANRIQTGTNGNTSMANNASFLFVYDATTSRWQLVGGTGSGSGSGSGKNYLSAITTSGSTTPNTGNGNFEAGSTVGWSLFNTTLTNKIPTGSITAGASSLTFGVTSTAPNVLAGTYSLNVTASSSWSAGQGVISDAFYIDQEDYAKVLSFKIAYKNFFSASNANFSGTSANTLAVYIYDVTNSQWIQPSGVYGITQSSGVGYVSGSFQTSSNGTQYRIAVLAANASSGSGGMYMDDFFVGPQIIPQGAVITDWQEYTPTITGFGTLLFNSAKSRRVGDTLEVQGIFVAGTPTATPGSISLGFNGGNSNISIDTSKISNGQTVVGVAGVNTWSTTYFGNYITVGTNTTAVQINTQTSTNSALQSTNGNITSGIGNTISYSFFVPIVGWSSTVQMSNDTDTRVISADVVGANTTVNNSTFTKLAFSGVSLDTAGSVSIANSRYTAPVSGQYVMSAFVATGAATGTKGFIFYKNGVSASPEYFSGTGAWQGITGTKILSLNAGDYIEVFGHNQSGTNESWLLQNFNIQRISGPSVIAASETVAVRYSSSSGQSIASSTDDVFKPTTKEIDTHGAFNTSTGIFTVPVSGLYSLNGLVTFNDFGGSNGYPVYMKAFGAVGVFTWTVTGISAKWGCGVNRTARLKAGDQISFTISQFTGAGKALFTNANFNYIDIVRVGN